MNAVKRGLFLVQLPPPIHGVSVMNERAVAAARESGRFNVEVLRLAYTREAADLNRASLAKIWTWLRLLFVLARKLGPRPPDFVYFTPVVTGIGFLRDVPFIALIRAFGVKAVVHLHGRGIAERVSNPLWRAVYRWGLRNCCVVSASTGMQACDVEPLDLQGSHLHVIPNSVERVNVRQFKVTCRTPATPRLLFLSNTFAFKGTHVLLESLRRLVEAGVAFEAEIVGASKPELDKEIGEFIAQNGLTRNVRCLGALYGAEKYAALGRADILVHPTLNDYFPLVVLEAMQFGLAIVATQVGAIPEIVTDGVHGTLVPPHDVDALTQAIERLIGTPELVRKMGAASRCRYETHYNPERFTTSLLEVLNAAATEAAS